MPRKPDPYVPRYFDTCPVYTDMISDGRRLGRGENPQLPLGLHAVNWGQGLPLWSGSIPPLPLGCRFLMPRLGPSKVLAFFLWNGWLGEHLYLEDPPGWHIRQYPADPYRTHIFGCELPHG